VSDLTYRALAATVPGVETRLACGVEKAYLRDYEVEIAQIAVGPNPVIEGYVAGTAVHLQVEHNDAGRFALRARLAYCEESEKLRTSELAVELMPDVEVPRVTSLTAAPELEIEPDRWTLLHVAPMPARDEAFVMIVRVRNENP
jgi:hypothetical protein